MGFGRRTEDGFRRGGREAEPPRADRAHPLRREQVGVHDEERAPRGGVLAGGVDADDAGDVAEGGERARLGREARAEGGIAGALWQEELHGAVDAERLVAAEPHLAHPAAPEKADGTKGSNGLSVRHGERG